MFKVYDKKTNNEVAVYGVESDKNGYPKFLVRLGNEWKWVSAKHFSDKEKECEHDWIYMGLTSVDDCWLGKHRCSKCGSYKYI